MSEEVIKDPIDEQKAGFVHLHCHSEYSSLDGGSRVKDMAKALKERGMLAMALTDHGVMQGLPEFYDTLKAEGIKPILGIEAYLTDDRFDKTRGTPTWHLTLLAENSEGYKNLCKLSSEAFIDGTIMTFGRPRARADWELLEKYSDGVIAFTGCMAAPVMSRIFDGDIAGAKKNTERLISIYGKDNVYGEIQNVGITVGIPSDSELAQKLGRKPLSEAEAAKYDEVEAGEVPLSQTDANRELVEICQELGIKYVATGDVHYLDESDADPHDAMICIGTGQLKNGSRRFSLLPKKYHLRTEEEMLAAVPDWPESLETTLEVAKRCSADIEYGRELLPRFPIPEGFEGSKDYLRHLCEEGLAERYQEGSELRKEALERLDFELSTIDEMGFNDYFLIVWDLFNEANKRSIPSGPGRGSAAGSIVAYCLDITKICPLENKLLFERFLNPGRRSMPDIDMDFGVRGREELIDYARQKYNDLADASTAVAQIVTYGKFKAKGALRDAARVMAEPSEEGRAEALKLGDRLSRLIPNDPGATMRSVWDDKKEGEQLRKAHKAGGKQAEAIKLAGWLEGFVRTNGIHAAAVLIADHDLSDDLPLQQFGPDKPLHVQYDMHYAEKLGLLKMDFLGLRNLDIIWDTVERIKHTHGETVVPYNLPLDDAETYELFARGETIGTFQFESTGMQAALKEVQPTEFKDLVALVALYRPGPMANIPTYAARKAGREEVTYLDDRLAETLDETYGVIVYQEQSMLLARQMAGFTPAEADDLRKAIGKKLRDKMDALKKPFFEGCKKNDVSVETAKWMWETNEAAADYSFNKSHAACYAYLAYITGYLKTHYPNEYMASLLTSVMGDKDKPRLYLTEAKRMGLAVLPPDVNRSLKDFAVLEREEEPGEWDILFGLTALRGVGSGVVGEIKQEREARGPFTSLFDLIRRMPHLNKTVIQSLIKGGALDSFDDSRKAMHDETEEAIKRIRKEHSARERDFVKCVVARMEEAGLADELLGVTPSGKQTKKLATLPKKGVEAASKLSWANKVVAEDDALQEVIEEGLTKEHLRLARAEVRKRVKEEAEALDEQHDDVAGIANEEGGESDKEKIEREAQEKLADLSDEIMNLAKTLLPLVKTALTDEWAEREETEMLDAVLEGEIDPVLDPAEWEDTERLRLERKTLGTYVTGHPLEADARAWAHYVSDGLGHINDKHIGQTLRVVGAVTGITEIKMRSGEILRRVSVEDLTGSREIIIFPRTLEGGLDQLLEEDAVVCFEVGVMEDTFTRAQNEDSDDASDEEGAAEKAVKIQASRLYRWEPDRVNTDNGSNGHKPVNIEISKEHFNREWVDQLRAVCANHPGDNPVRLVLDGKGHKTELRVKPSESLVSEIEELLSDVETPV